MRKTKRLRKKSFKERICIEKYGNNPKIGYLKSFNSNIAGLTGLEIKEGKWYNRPK